MTRGAPLFPDEQRRWHRIHSGLATERQEHIFNWIAVVIVLLFVAAWIGAVAESNRQQRAAPPPVAGTSATASPRTPTAEITGAIMDERPTVAPAFISEAMLGFLNPLRGQSGALRYAPVLPGSEVVPAAPGGPAVAEVPENPGIYKLAVEFQKATRQIDDLNVVTLVPISKKRGGKIGLYYLGSWPWEKGGTPKSPKYAPPSGFIEVTPENKDFQVSEHFRLRDFLTKDQPNVWPKYLLLNPELIDKLELTIQELEKQGIDVKHMQVMSGFRTPRYNHSGGNTAGRANLSRHMYGDACDIFVDNDRNGNMDDINRDGRVNARDAELISEAAERVERRYRSLVGGIGVYSACCGHGPFTHIDVRGYRARWRGTGNG